MRSRQSFNLVELSLAVAVTAIGIVSVFGILPHLLKTSRQAVEFSAITMDVQNRIDDPDHRGLLSTNDILNAALFPTLAAPYRSPVIQPGFEGHVIFSTVLATNGDCTPGYRPDNYTSFTNKFGTPLLKTLYFTYIWGATNNVTNMQKFTFITETAVTTNVTLYGP